MQTGLFYRLGKLIYRYRWAIIIFWLVLLLACIPALPKLMDPFTSIGFVDSNSQSAKAEKILNEKIGYGSNQFIVIYQSPNLLATSNEFQKAIKYSLANLSKIKTQHEILYPNTNNKSQISKDKHTAYAVILFKGSQEIDPKILTLFKSHIRKPANLSMGIGGEPVFLDDTKTQTQLDLYKAEYIATPTAIITMLLVFGTVVAASLPILLGGIGTLFILTALFLLGHVFNLSVFTINIALLLGLCLSLDYALFIVSRFREELDESTDIQEVIAITFATAGKAIFFSGLAVFASLSALLLFRINVLISVGVGGLAAVFVSVAIATILLPAILAVLQRRINSLPIPFLHREKLERKHFWRKVVTHVVNHRYISFFAILFLLLFLGYPFLNAKFGISSFRILPETMQSRQVFDIFEKKFSESRLAPITVIVQSNRGDILTKNNIYDLYQLTNEIKKDTRVEQISSIVNTEPRLTKEQYYLLYSHPKQLNSDFKKLLRVTTHKDLTAITIVSKYESTAPETKALIKKLQHMHADHGMTLQVAGSTLNTIDVLSSISHTFPYAVLWIVGFSYLILLVLLRSFILPIKAIIMTMLSLFASYGVLTFVIQSGHFAHFLNFAPQGMLDISLLIIIFCTLFGISMDYEVFLLTRIKEDHEHNKNTIKSILAGIDHSSKIITSAAIIVILLCFSFMTADILIVKAFGLGIAVAAFVDAFIIRTVFVPATMAILGKWNWYLPRWLDRLLPNIVFDPHKKKPLP